MIVDQFKEIVLPQIVDNLLSLIPVLMKVAIGILLPFIIIFAFGIVVLLICPELRDIVGGTIGGIYHNYKSDRLERFRNSPVGRGYAAYKERVGVHDGASYSVESYSLGPVEHSVDSDSFSGYDYNMDYGNVEFVDLED
jgi:hypothetical protein